MINRPSDEIEVTDAMIEAAIDVLAEGVVFEVDARTLAKRALRAALAQRKSLPAHAASTGR